MSDLNFDINNSNNAFISEKDLYEIFESQYDDLFCKILKINEKSFIYFLKQQVLLNLQITKKNASKEQLKDYLDLFIKRYKEQLKLVKNNFDIIKQKEKNEVNTLIFLDITKCYIHCHNCFCIEHKCGNKLILYDEYIYCTKCNNVYNKNQIMLYCIKCKKNYLSKLRKPVFNGEKILEKIFLVKFKKYHCDTNKEEKIKCLKCSNNLYFRLSQNSQINDNNNDNINIIYCIKCRLKYFMKNVFFKCKICLQNFKAEAKIFRDFSHKDKTLLFLIHTFLRNKNAIPNLQMCEKNCDCNLKRVTEYYHYDDNGKLLEGIKNTIISVVCTKCNMNYKYENIKWKCPKCGKGFKYKNDNKSNTQSDNSLIDFGEEYDIYKSRNIPIFKVNLKKITTMQDSNLVNKDKDQEKYKENGVEVYDTIKNNDNNNSNNNIIIKNVNHIRTINLDYNLNKTKNIYFNKNETNKITTKTKYSLRKSRSKNDIKSNKLKNKYNDIDLIKKGNKNIIKMSRPVSKSKILNKIQIEEKYKKENNNKYRNEINLIKDNPDKKEEKKKCDTKEIFNKIKDNIYNIDDNDYDLNSKELNKYGIRKGFPEGKKEKNQIHPIYKNIKYLNKNNLELDNTNQKQNLRENNKKSSNLLLKEQKIDDIQIDPSHQILSTQNFDNVQIEQNDKNNIKYSNEIYLNNPKNQNELELKNDNNQGKQPDIFPKNMKKNYIIRNKSKHLYENVYLYENNTSFQNFNNYYLNYNDDKEYQEFDLYNFNSQNYSIIKLLGKGANGKIYLVLDMQTNQNFALKSMLIDNESQLKIREDEYNLIYKLTYDNPELKIVNIYGLEIRRIDQYNIFFNVLMEAAISDWEMEIISRKKKNMYYTEEELIYILSNLNYTLAFLQEKHICHRDIKPQNILYFGNNEYKICDFGEAKYTQDFNDKIENKNSDYNYDKSKQTIRGTELYMSPILFKAVKYRPNSLTRYNSFKSDVFSLGLCFLYASCLDTKILFKIREIFDMKKISDIVNECLKKRYSQNYINILLNMLQIDENNRLNFIELRSLFIYENS